MKKTIIAASIAAVVAAPAAFADVKISGQTNVEFFQSGEAINGNDVAKDELGVDRNTDIVVSVSEDLDNGMKAFATISIVDDASSNDGASNNTGTVGTGHATTGAGMGSGSTQIVGLATDFGTITMGKQEMFIESKAAAMAANDAADYLSNEVSTSVGETGEGTVEYTSPAMGGFKAVISARGETTASGNTDDLDKTGFGVEYSNAGLLVRAATMDDNGTDTNVLGVQYSMGDLKMGVVTAEEGTANRQTWYGASYKMGNNELAVSTTDSSTRGANDTIVSLKHSLSKNVAAYIVYDDDSATAAANDGSTTLVGMQVKF
jgi:hypothetical protein